ncbi:hypothetical protein B0A55_08286 [Friedmanniomyces simplex]|uniref:CREG-like beta-barrel domain-containing protein n=1 Tax=Friedmanniomyces simplex TaxID=329884 RepID=A0A4U0WQ92_9PEZI|nr:hypothetical protein B0A55_08286 [Friedmanniomyces simplex]
MARRIMHLSSLGTLVSTFPEPSHAFTPNSNEGDEVYAYENRPQEMAGSPIGLMEYYADCEPETGNPTLLAINIATPYRNYAAGSNISLQIRWWPTQSNSYDLSASSHVAQLENEEIEDDEDIPTPHTPAALPRFSLHGRLEPIPAKDLVASLVPACFMRAHPDSLLWQPGNDIHTSQYMRFVVEHIYWFGGFGDRARIGWLPVEEWRNVTKDEVEGMRLPGEKGWRDLEARRQGRKSELEDEEVEVEVEWEVKTEGRHRIWGPSTGRDHRILI